MGYREYYNYYLALSKRAFSDTYQFAKDLKHDVGLVIIAGLVGVYKFGFKMEFSMIENSFFVLGVLVFCIFIWNLLLALARIDQEQKKTIQSQNEEIDKLRKDLQEQQARKPILSIERIDKLDSEMAMGHIVYIKNQEGCSEAINCRGYLSLDAQKKDIIRSLKDFGSNVTSMMSNRGNSYTPSELDKWVLSLIYGQVKIHLIGDTFTEIKESQICWTEIKNPPSIDIGGGEEKGLDICRVLRGIFLHVCIPTSAEWDNVLAILKEGDYKGELIVRSDNADTLKRRFTITPDNTKKDIDIAWVEST